MIPLDDFPQLNAWLNATTACLLLAGLAAIKARKVRLHRFCMVSALLVSVCFLGCYLYYHFHHGATPFPGRGWVRPLYFAILISHTLLAVINVPLVLITVCFALRQQFERHRRIARWTWLIWMYVSVSGVAIYWMLYRIAYKI